MAKLTYETDTGQQIHVQLEEQLILDLHEKGVDLISELCRVLSSEVRASIQSRIHNRSGS